MAKVIDEITSHTPPKQRKQQAVSKLQNYQNHEHDQPL